MSYGEMADNWCLWNANYHQMVSALLRLVTTLSPLRVEAPEWYPAQVKGQVREDDVSDEGLKKEEWTRKKRFLKIKLHQMKLK